jgi:LysM repeat protein
MSKSPLPGSSLLWPLLAAAWLFFCPQAQAQSSHTHTVAPGETVASIAQQHKVPIWKLKAVNGLSATAALKPGTVLLLPNPAQKAKNAKAQAQRAMAAPPSPLDLLEAKSKPDMKSGYLGSSGKAKARVGEVDLRPQMRPAVDMVSPKGSAVGDPEAPVRKSPGIEATLHAKDDLDIVGVINSPYEFTYQPKPYAKDGSPGSSPSAGLMLRKSF